jgi:hypothetical protein
MEVEKRKQARNMLQPPDAGLGLILVEMEKARGRIEGLI